MQVGKRGQGLVHPEPRRARYQSRCRRRRLVGGAHAVWRDAPPGLEEAGLDDQVCIPRLVLDSFSTRGLEKTGRGRGAEWKFLFLFPISHAQHYWHGLSDPEAGVQEVDTSKASKYSGCAFDTEHMIHDT